VLIRPGTEDRKAANGELAWRYTDEPKLSNNNGAECNAHTFLAYGENLGHVLESSQQDRKAWKSVRQEQRRGDL
jgi:hypothetical protein